MPNISNVRLIQLENAEKQLLLVHKKQSIEWVGNRLGEALATILANKPYSLWSKAEKQLLNSVCNTAFTSLELYISLLPKE